MAESKIPFKGMKKVELYNGAKKVNSWVQLSDAPTNYDFLIIYSRANAANDTYVDYLPVNGIESNIQFDHIIGDKSYSSSMVVWLDGSRLGNSMLSYNQNWIIGIIAVYGVKFY